MYYFRNRYYDPDTGRFIQRDPIGLFTDQTNFGNGCTFGGSSWASASDPTGEKNGTGPRTRNRGGGFNFDFGPARRDLRRTISRARAREEVRRAARQARRAARDKSEAEAEIEEHKQELRIDVFDGAGRGVWVEFTELVVAHLGGEGSYSSVKDVSRRELGENIVLEFFWTPPQAGTSVKNDTTPLRKKFRWIIVDSLFAEEVVLRRSIAALTALHDHYRRLVPVVRGGSEESDNVKIADWAGRILRTQRATLVQIQKERGVYEVYQEEREPGATVMMPVPENIPLMTDEEYAERHGVSAEEALKILREGADGDEE